MTHEERLALAIKFNKQWIATRQVGQIATKDMILADTLSAEENKGLVSLYPGWELGRAYAVDDLVSYNDTLYKVIQAHISQADWTPDIVPALFTSKAPVGVIPEWVQPTGATDAYNTGDKVTFEGVVYESLIDANVWSPTGYPAGWKLV